MKAGVIAVQGDVAEHAAAVRNAAAAHDESAEVVEIRESGVVPDCDVLLMPGGESTTISRLIHREGIAAEIRDHAAAGKPILATCAGLIVCSTDAKDDRVEPLGLVDVSVDRNAFGRQKDSFEAKVPVTGLDDPFHAVFIRAPAIDDVGDGVETLATVDGRPVAVRDGPVVATAFHPELTDDPRIHDLAFFPEREVVA
ncbi:pyridoxal 5'-phosphate synthase glutaminase subunit PdxT [Halorubrum ezzemoulense]|uniref:Pyridoxal 5'-phosphate synthase subunit PdxT n=2 Tax=Halorubrum ezzemoulense TaxID=337243 RepID=A0A256J882_HALEZ|nr:MULTISPECIES: pyridoxal 5'-phosphate synthase glutaminase subunit PdxT [Halorubrum]MDB2224524.1 pyridoxal 5'-phosphate synthase glutaminase subunit PdxT [Halorubrum ezzemoulense]MDB2242483.1 pyridoxal 5'-phosphate synthase glutaminase subunit PdxT [Halorubrum ezzemoulense]MDB2261967.1 pyridoxal 5'-phosphate synthase glutaminase subunit PdxT [Halorubrum ezzemoulense]MDB2264813.1 pyridoxal 5'-phosphate synthase glutaminase subunit PdxT [Halorubrum ezzemoulense]MDB2268636.1 pyridoxal 5'-phosph